MLYNRHNPDGITDDIASTDQKRGIKAWPRPQSVNSKALSTIKKKVLKKTKF